MDAYFQWKEPTGYRLNSLLRFGVPPLSGTQMKWLFTITAFYGTQIMLILAYLRWFTTDKYGINKVSQMLKWFKHSDSRRKLICNADTSILWHADNTDLSFFTLINFQRSETMQKISSSVQKLKSFMRVAARRIGIFVRERTGGTWPIQAYKRTQIILIKAYLRWFISNAARRSRKFHLVPKH